VFAFPIDPVVSWKRIDENLSGGHACGKTKAEGRISRCAIRLANRPIHGAIRVANRMGHNLVPVRVKTPSLKLVPGTVAVNPQFDRNCRIAFLSIQPRIDDRDRRRPLPPHPDAARNGAERYDNQQRPQAELEAAEEALGD